MPRALIITLLTGVLVVATVGAILTFTTHSGAPVFVTTPAASVAPGRAEMPPAAASTTTFQVSSAPVKSSESSATAAVVSDGPRDSATSGYSVSMLPMGNVHFAHLPVRIVTQDANYNDMLVALGEQSHLLATGYRGNFYDGFYKELGPSIALDPSTLVFLSKAGGGMFDKEALYALHPDVFHIDPLQLAAAKGWSQSDVDEIAHNVAPFFANRYSRENNYRGKMPYAYYTVWELSEKVGEVYQRAERIRALKTIYEHMLATIQARLPPVDQRPRIGLVFYNKKGTFTPFTLAHGGFGQAQYRDVGARDAFADIKASTSGTGDGGAALDLEGLVAIAPDVLIMPFGIYPASSGSATSRASFELLLKLRDDPLAGQLAAFRDGRIYPGGTPLQGPIFYLFQVEMAAKQIYPAIFGAYRDDQAYPVQEQLFDRAQVAAIVEGTSVAP